MNAPTITIRAATRADVADIVRLLADDVLGRGREQIEPLPASYYEAFAAIVSSPRDELVVAEVDGKVVGTLQLTVLTDLTHRGGRRAHIEAVRVDNALRGLGIGAQLFAWVIERARQHGCHLVQLTTNKQRSDAQRFYERLGFVASHVGYKLDLNAAPQ